MRWSNAKVLYVDVETSGLNPANNCVVELAMDLVDYGGAAHSERYHTLVMPEAPGNNYAYELNGLDWADLMDAPPWPEAWREDLWRLADVVVAYRAEFDRRHIEAMHARHGRIVEYPKPWLDVLPFNHRWPRKATLESEGTARGVSFNNLPLHTAAGDVELLRRIVETRWADWPDTIEATLEVAEELSKYGK